MSFYKKIKYYLVHSLSYTNKEAQQLIDKGMVEIEGTTIFENCLLTDEPEIRIRGTMTRARQNFVYLKFYKPVGYQSDLNQKVENNLASFFKEYKDLFIAGRLDKASEGLLILSNDGKWVEKLCNPKFEKEKEYIVTLDKNPDLIFIGAFKNGVNIGNHITKACECSHIGENAIKVILKEGKNRQIRRMCKALGYSVTALKRLRISEVSINNLKPGESENIEKIQI